MSKIDTMTMIEEVMKILTESTLTPDQAGTSTRNGPHVSAGANGPHPVDAQKFKGKLPDEEEKKHDSLSEDATLTIPKKDQLLKLFKLQMSENWGKLDTLERQELERVVRTATAGQTDVHGRLRVIQRQMTMLREGTLGKIKNPRRILSQIILLETFNRLFKSFQPSPAGFINEGLLTSDGSPISIKTKIDGKAQVDGSIKNLYKSLNGSKTGKVYFDIFLKKPDGKKDVGSLTFVRFIVDSSNINEFLDLDLFEPDPKNPQMVVLKREYRDSFLAESLSEGIAGTKLTEKDAIEKIKELALQNSEGERTPIGDPEALAAVLDVPVDAIPKISDKLIGSSAFREAGEDLPSENDDATYDEYVKDIARIWKSFRGKKKIHYDKDRNKIETEFDLSQGTWMKFASEQGNMVQKPIVLTFDDESIERTIAAAVEDIDEAITDMFNGLASFTGTVQTYLTTIASNRAMIGEKATREANELPVKTERVVDVAGTDPAKDEND
jgi:hypothetical protein